MLKTVDLNKSLEVEVYKPELLKWQLKLREQAYQLYQKQRSLVVGCSSLPDSATFGSSTSRVPIRAMTGYAL